MKKLTERMLRQIIREEKQKLDEETPEYQKFFRKALAKFGVSSPDELEDDKKKALFNYVDKNWKADKETD